MKPRIIKLHHDSSVDAQRNYSTQRLQYTATQSVKESLTLYKSQVIQYNANGHSMVSQHICYTHNNQIV
jgi:hypothetical protein